jgi:hypothetical protein
MPAEPVEEGPRGGPAPWAACVGAACRAAGGDEAAYRWLLWAASVAPPEDWRVSYLVAAAAQQHGGRADQAWRRLVLQHGIATGLTASEHAAVAVSGRDRFDVEAAGRTVAQVEAALHEAGSVGEPGPVLHAARRLRERGDLPGARLLLTAAVQRRAPCPALSAALEDVTPPALRAYRWAVWSLLVVCAGLLPVGGLGLFVLIAGGHLWIRVVPVPGLGRTDSRVWRQFSLLQYDDDTGRADPPGLRHVSVLQWLGGALGLVLGWNLGMAVDGSLADGAARSSLLAGWAHYTAFAASFLLPVVVLLVAATRVQRHLDRRRLTGRRAARDRVLDEEAAGCQCWRSALLVGRFSERYSARHLVPLPAPDVSPRLRAVLPEGAELSRCPATGALWLGGRLGFAGVPLLLRGPVPDPSSGTGPRPHAPTGFYL